MGHILLQWHVLADTKLSGPLQPHATLRLRVFGSNRAQQRVRSSPRPQGATFGKRGHSRTFWGRRSSQACQLMSEFTSSLHFSLSIFGELWSKLYAYIMSSAMDLPMRRSVFEDRGFLVSLRLLPYHHSSPSWKVFSVLLLRRVRPILI